jgi:hypothetical protein
MSTPVLRHETGEALGGGGKFRVRAQLETSRLFPVVPADIAAPVTANQEGGLFRGGFFSIHGAAGVTKLLDVQLGTFYTITGGGWRLGSKYQLMQRGRLAMAGMIGYGRFSAKGTQSFSTVSGPVDVSHTLSASSLDISFPVSIRFSKGFALYSGLAYYRSDVTGSADMTGVNDYGNDIGTNVGVKINYGKFEGDIETAFVWMKDTIADSLRLVPYWGFSVGLNF